MNISKARYLVIGSIIGFILGFFFSIPLGLAPEEPSVEVELVSTPNDDGGWVIETANKSLHQIVDTNPNWKSGTKVKIPRSKLH